jgi:formate hydrogenlyase subunit 6/NADH:ubiquinone oxidoreductase subunit I
MMGKRIIVMFPSREYRDSLIHEAVLKSGTIFNTLSVETTPTDVKVMGEIKADEEKSREFIRILKRMSGVVKELGVVMKFDPEKCVACGLCFSLCPTRAIILNKDFSIKFDFDECVLCMNCVNNCPVNAVSYLGD